jgi:hypothetical protein
MPGCGAANVLSMPKICSNHPKLPVHDPVTSCIRYEQPLVSAMFEGASQAPWLRFCGLKCTVSRITHNRNVSASGFDKLFKSTCVNDHQHTYYGGLL